MSSVELRKKNVFSILKSVFKHSEIQNAVDLSINLPFSCFVIPRHKMDSVQMIPLFLFHV